MYAIKGNINGELSGFDVVQVCLKYKKGENTIETRRDGYSVDQWG